MIADRFLIPLLVLSVLQGCGPGSNGVSIRVVSWSSEEPDGQNTPGVHSGQVFSAEMNGASAMTIWADCNGAISGQADGTVTKVEGTLLPNDGRTVKVSTQVHSGQSSHVLIDEQQFDLAKGRFFLVATSDGKTRVEQRNRTLPAAVLNASAENLAGELQKLAKTDSEITAFFSTPVSTTP